MPLTLWRGMAAAALRSLGQTTKDDERVPIGDGLTLAQRVAG